MNRIGQDIPINPGTDVLGFDGAKVGVLVARHPDHLVVEKGYLAPIRYRIPISAIAGGEDGSILLNLTKYQALHQGWDVPPAGGRSATTTTGNDTLDVVATDTASNGAGAEHVTQGDMIAGRVAPHPALVGA